MLPYQNKNINNTIFMKAVLSPINSLTFYISSFLNISFSEVRLDATLNRCAKMLYCSLNDIHQLGYLQVSLKRQNHASALPTLLCLAMFG